MFSGMGEQLISASYVFGGSAIAFSTLPFAFIILKAILDGQRETTSGADVIGTFILALLVHVVSCIAFMGSVYVMDTVGSGYSANYLQDKAFKIFWTMDKSAVFATAGVTGVTGSTVEAEGAYITLLTVQQVVRFLYALLPLAVMGLGATYGFLQAKKDVYRTDILSSSVWTILATIVAVVLYYIWAGIASLALFMPNSDLVTYTHQVWVDILNKGN